MRLFRVNKSRKYPVQYDDIGQSLRTRCFKLFDEGKRPVEVAKELGMKETTAYKYFQQGKRLGPNFERKYSYVKDLLKPSAPDRNHTLELFARACGITKKELETILDKPHGLRRLMTEKFSFPGHENIDRKRQVALEVALCISNHLTEKGGNFEDVLFAFERLMSQRKKYRKEEDADIEEENREIAFTRQVIEADARIEQQGRPRGGRLTEEERNAIIKWKLESKARNLEKQYFLRVAELMAEGLTQEQAEGKIVKDLIDKGDIKGADIMRRYQDFIHNRKSANQVHRTPPA